MAEDTKVNEHIDLTESKNYEKGHSVQSSISSSASALLRKGKQSNAFESYEASAREDKKRLSNMLEQFSSTSIDEFEDADEFIANRSDQNSTPDNKTVPQIFHPNQDLHLSNKSLDSFEFEKPPQNLLQITPTSALSGGSNNRVSMISDYAPSIHEVNEVAYVVQDRSTSPVEFINEDENALEHGDVLLSKNPSVLRKIVSSNSSSKKSDSENHIKNKESVTSDSSHTTGTASASGSSKYPLSVYSAKIAEVQNNTILESTELEDNKSTNLSVSDQTYARTSQSFNHNLRSSSAASSIEIDIGTLKTKKENLVLPQSADRSRSTEITPSIPSRSPNRPKSHYLGAPSERIVKLSERPKSVEIQAIDDLMSELDEEISKSPLIDGDEVQIEAVDELSEKHQLVSHLKKNSFTSQSPRPLPPPPVPTHKLTPNESSHSNHEILADDGFVTEDESAELQTESHKKDKRKHTSRSRKKSINESRKSANFKKGHFSQDTLMQMLQVTEGTIIGQEFQDLGLEQSEKQLLERLVDSLSRLTADMIIDSERHDESVRRLNKAIKALEGF
ncbi:hypothetical protein WICMUC_004679 [Wickerhamomyces mucosus]|uniref:Protein NBA1 n=1 Tax=Wickerhamomyces mucosus TaxID=1378264 RepID=A0A9P8PHI6_9ASCO|nr:hypothetical protein WICMUC_004679 [Wickerhamomyces mucosus]